MANKKNPFILLFAFFVIMSLPMLACDDGGSGGDTTFGSTRQTWDQIRDSPGGFLADEAKDVPRVIQETVPGLDKVGPSERLTCHQGAGGGSLQEAFGGDCP